MDLNPLNYFRKKRKAIKEKLQIINNNRRLKEEDRILYDKFMMVSHNVIHAEVEPTLDQILYIKLVVEAVLDFYRERDIKDTHLGKIRDTLILMVLDYGEEYLEEEDLERLRKGEVEVVYMEGR